MEIGGDVQSVMPVFKVWSFPMLLISFFTVGFRQTARRLLINILALISILNGACLMCDRHGWLTDRGYEWWLMVEAKKRNPSVLTYGMVP